MNESHRNAIREAQPHKHPRPLKRELAKLYIGKLMSTRQLATHYNVTQGVVRRWIKLYDIPVRGRREAASGRPPKGAAHWNWKGDEAGYQALHTWVRSQKGTPMKCEHCGRTDKKKYEWANISKEYLRDVDDWVRLCTACHRKFDII